MPAVKVMGWLLVDSVETHISEVATYFLTGIFDQLIGLHISFRPLAGNVRMLSVFLYQLSIKREEEGNNGSGSRQHLPGQKMTGVGHLPQPIKQRIFGRSTSCQRFAKLGAAPALVDCFINNIGNSLFHDNLVPRFTSLAKPLDPV